MVLLHGKGGVANLDNQSTQIANQQRTLQLTLPSSRRNALKGHWPYPKTLSDVWWRWGLTMGPSRYQAIELSLKPSEAGWFIECNVLQNLDVWTCLFFLILHIICKQKVCVVFRLLLSTPEWSVKCVFCCLQLYVEKTMIRCGSRMQRWWKIPCLHQAGGNTQGVGMPQISVGFRGVFVWVLTTNVWQTKMP